MLQFVRGDISILEHNLGRRLSHAEKLSVKEITTKLYQARMFVLIDFSNLQITHYSPPVSFDLSKTDKIFNVRPFETPETINKGQCEII